jgi:hypothetical protein
MGSARLRRRSGMPRCLAVKTSLDRQSTGKREWELVRKRDLPTLWVNDRRSNPQCWTPFAEIALYRHPVNVSPETVPREPHWNPRKTETESPAHRQFVR